MLYPIVPVGKPRMTQRDKWAKRPAVLRYRAFCDEVRAAGVQFPQAGARVTFFLPMPKSWSRAQRDRMRMTGHQAKPDLDNLLKALMDACLEDDAGVWSIGGMQKLWADEGGILIGGEA